jgi:hypothetical protein
LLPIKSCVVAKVIFLFCEMTEAQGILSSSKEKVASWRSLSQRVLLELRTKTGNWVVWTRFIAAARMSFVFPALGQCLRSYGWSLIAKLSSLLTLGWNEEWFWGQRNCLLFSVADIDQSQRLEKNFEHPYFFGLTEQMTWIYRHSFDWYSLWWMKVQLSTGQHWWLQKEGFGKPHYRKF